MATKSVEFTANRRVQGVGPVSTGDVRTLERGLADHLIRQGICREVDVKRKKTSVAAATMTDSGGDPGTDPDTGTGGETEV